MLNYRTTPHTTTKVAPAQLLFNRVVNNGIPETANPNLHPVPTQEHAKAQLCDAEPKKKSKMYADLKRHAREPPQRRYPIRNRHQTSFYEAVQGVSKAKTQTF